MKLLLFIIVALFASVGVTLLAMENPGYVLIAREPWSVEMPLTLFSVLFVVATLLLALLWRLLVRLWNIPRDVARWRQLRHDRKNQDAIGVGLTYLAEGHWATAEKRLLADLHHNPAPMLNYLAAAYAAQAQGDSEKRDEYLSLAHQSTPDNDLAVSMTKSYLHYLSHQYERALATLTQLRAFAPDHPAALKLLAFVFRELRDWASLANLIASLRKNRALPAGDIDSLEMQAHRELLILSLPAGSVGVLEKAWEVVPQHLRQQPMFINIYARHLLKQQEMDRCAALLHDAIEQRWDDELVYLYGLARSSDPETQLQATETWALSHPDNPWLLLTLGRLAGASKLRAKAVAYLERCVSLRELPEAYTELGALAEQSGQTDKAREYYRRALSALGHGREAAEKGNGLQITNGIRGSAAL